VFDGKPYDVGHHSGPRAVRWLRIKMGVTPPLALLLSGRCSCIAPPTFRASSAAPRRSARKKRPCSPHIGVATATESGHGRGERVFRNNLIAQLPVHEHFWVGLFYLVWIYYFVPAPAERLSALVFFSLLLLALPGYPKSSA